MLNYRDDCCFGGHLPDLFLMASSLPNGGLCIKENWNQYGSHQHLPAGIQSLNYAKQNL
jgi:hypothetical protein